MGTITYTAERGHVMEKKPAKDLADFWAPKVRTYHDKFEASLRKSHAEAIALGKALLEAKAALPHGEFGRLFSGHEDPVEGHLPFVHNWACRLMKIANNPALADSQHAVKLPADLEAIYELATMKAAELTAAIEAGKVTPSTTRKEAKEIKAEFSEAKKEPREDDGDRKARKAAERSAGDTLDDCIQRVEEAIADALLSHPEIRKAIVGRLKLIVEGMK